MSYHVGGIDRAESPNTTAEFLAMLEKAGPQAVIHLEFGSHGGSDLYDVAPGTLRFASSEHMGVEQDDDSKYGDDQPSPFSWEQLVAFLKTKIDEAKASRKQESSHTSFVGFIAQIGDELVEVHFAPNNPIEAGFKLGLIGERNGRMLIGLNEGHCQMMVVDTQVVAECMTIKGGCSSTPVRGAIGGGSNLILEFLDPEEAGMPISGRLLKRADEEIAAYREGWLATV